MKLFYSKGACSLVCRIVINEIGLPCEYESVDLATKNTEHGSDFLKINPKGSVPVLQLDGGEVLTENAVILQYLADSSKAIHLLPAMGDFKRYRVLEWLNYTTTELHKGFSPFFNPHLPEEIKKQFFLPLIKNKLTYLDKHLQHNNYLMGKELTLPDPYMFVMLLWAAHIGLNLKEWAQVSRYFDELGKRDSIRQSLKEEKLV